MNTTQILSWIGIASALITIIGGGGVLGWWWRKQPERDKARERNEAVADAILGEPEVKDRSGEQIQPARPGLVHRVATVEETLVEFRHVVGLLTETQHTLTDHGARLKALEDARLERIVTQAAAGQAWRALAENTIDEPSPSPDTAGGHTDEAADLD